MSQHTATLRLRTDDRTVRPEPGDGLFLDLVGESWYAVTLSGDASWSFTEDDAPTLFGREDEVPDEFAVQDVTEKEDGWEVTLTW